MTWDAATAPCFGRSVLHATVSTPWFASRTTASIVFFIRSPYYRVNDARRCLAGERAARAAEVLGGHIVRPVRGLHDYFYFVREEIFALTLAVDDG